MKSDTKDFEQLLSRVELFTGLNDKFIRGLAKACRLRHCKAGEKLVSQGEPGIGLFVIRSGKVKIQKRKDSGETIDIAEHGTGEIVGEMAVLDGAPRTADVVAVDDTECLVLPAWEFNSFMESHPKVAFHILPVVVKRFRETNEALLSLQQRNE